MPPKKLDKNKKNEESPVAYNTDAMSLEQLKQYARLLEGEIEAIRKHCNFYQKMEDELVELLRVTEDELRLNENIVLSKDIELEKLKLNFYNQLKEKRYWPEYMNHTNTGDKEKLCREISQSLENEENRHFEETNRLQRILQEKDHQLETLKAKIDSARKEIQEKNENYLKEMEEQQKDLLEKSFQRFNSIIKETEEDFRKAKEIMECEAHEDKNNGEGVLNNACEGFKKKLQNYYKDVTRQDLNTIKKLKNDIKKLEDSIKTSKQSLQKARSQKSHFEASVSKRTSLKSAESVTKSLRPTAALNMHKKTEKLALDNQKLEAQIKSVIDKINNLKMQFTLALKRIRESAEKKSDILERKLNFILEEE